MDGYYIHHRGVVGTSQPQPLRALSTANSAPRLSPGLVGGPSPVSYSNLDAASPHRPSAASYPQAEELPPHGGNAAAPAFSAGVGNQMEPPKRKRGRPRKFGTEGSMSLARSPVSPTPQGSGVLIHQGSSSSGAKRGRGRPPGSGRKQQLALLGEWFSGSAGMGFRPHVITMAVGEDIAAKVMSFSQQGPRAVCILSANGAVSTVTLRQPATSGGTVTYEGRFEILCLSGSFLLTKDGGSRSRNGNLSISLSSPDGRVIGGGVGGLLIAATPVQVIVGSFTYGGSKGKDKIDALAESGPASEPDLLPTDDKQGITSSLPLPNRSLTSSLMMGGWSVSRQIDTMDPHIDIDLTSG